MKATEFEDPFEVLETEAGPHVDLRPMMEKQRRERATVFGIALGLPLGWSLYPMGPWAWLFIGPAWLVVGAWIVRELWRHIKARNGKEGA